MISNGHVIIIGPDYTILKTIDHTLSLLIFPKLFEQISKT